MVDITPIREIRPRLMGEFEVREFQPRTPAIAEAFRWGKEVHGGQLRLSGEPYFETHCGWVADFLDRLIGNEAWTIAGLLHDAIEDKGGSLDAIKEHFPGALGEEVAHIVDGVTKLSNPRDGRSREMETLRKIAMFRDPAVFLVKLADKSHNLMTLHHMSPAKRVQKATEAIRAYGRLAGILNCYKWRRWIEDMAFPFAEPEAYNFVKPRIDSDPRLQVDFINHMQWQLGGIMERCGIDGRIEIIVNGYLQAWQKLRRMARTRRTSLNTFTNLNDMISFRMIVAQENLDACYVLLGALNRHFNTSLDHNRFDDYIACPQNGYRALQVTAWLPQLGAVEVAIATNDMEGENLWGVVYAIQHGKDIQSYRPVEILTPSMGVRFVPEGSSVLDAVASIQQELLLNKISAVKVNNNLVSLADKVEPGDIVEVITGGQRLTPSEDWLNFCNTFTAPLLRTVLANEGLRNAAEKGRQEIRGVLAARSVVALEDVLFLERDKVDNLLSVLACTSLDDLYAAVGGGAIRNVDLEHALDEAQINSEALGWMTLNISGSEQTNKPGVLVKLAGIVSKMGGNIIRSVNNTLPDGSFAFRMIVRGISAEQRDTLRQSFYDCGIDFNALELV